MRYTLAEKSELADNKAPKLPVCFCVEASSYVCDNRRQYKHMNEALDKLLKKIQSTNTLKSTVDFCLITFAAKAETACEFTLGGPESLDICRMDGEPDLRNALVTSLREIRVRENELKAYRNARKRGVLVVYSSGRSSTPLEELAENLAYLDRNKLDVIPIMTENGNDRRLRSITCDGTVYNGYDCVDEIFEMIGKSIQNMSESSEATMPRFDEAEDWEKYKRRAK